MTAAKFSSRLNGLETSGIRKLFEMAGKDVIHLGIGEPDFQPPSHVVEALHAAALGGQNKYGPIAGVMPLREAIAAKVKKYSKSLGPENVIVTMGASEGLMLCAMAFYEKGDEIVIPNPGFVFYRPHAEMFGARAVPYSLKQEGGFEPDIEEIKRLITPRTKAIIVNSPSNPTGGAYSEETVNAISDLANDRGLVVISDEVYDGIVYDGEHHSFLGRAENAVYLNSFSKTYAMTGWRIGYTVTRPEFADALSKLHYYTVACPATPVQVAAAEALTGPQGHIPKMVEEFKARRDIIVSELNSIPGFSCATPRGAFYVFPSFDFKMTDKELAMALLKAGVVCTPGSSFGSAGEGHLRFSYANSREKIMKGIEIVRNAAKAMPRK